MRLIDADELKSLYDDAEFVGEKWHVPIRVILANIDDMPTVNPIKHGHWIIDTKFGADVMSGEQMVICSVCGRGIFWGKQNYCPNCGAMMDEEAVHDDHL